MLSARQCNVALFREIRENINSLQIMLDHNKNSEQEISYTTLIRHLLVLTSFQSGVPADADQLQQGCKNVLDNLDAVIADESSSDALNTDPFGRINDEFFKRNEEEFRNKISQKNPIVKELYSRLSDAAKELCNAVNEDFPADSCDVIYDTINNAVVMRKRANRKRFSNVQSSYDGDNEDAAVAGNGNTSKGKAKVEYLPCYDRKGILKPKDLTTARVSRALGNYLYVASELPIQITNILQDLSTNIYEEEITIRQASHWAVILLAAQAHTEASIQKGWTLATLSDFINDDKDSNQADFVDMTVENTALIATGMTPYWIDRLRSAKNDIELKNIFILTAPNMSGKSTLMRSIIVTAILANCGLFVPCTTAIVPRYDNFFLRTASYDIPSEAKSAFALEMDDIRVVLRDATSKSLVMIDELGNSSHVTFSNGLSS